MTKHHDILKFTRSERQILKAAGIPDSFAGAALVVETAIRATKLASDLWPDSPITEWHEASLALRKSIRRATDSSAPEASILFQRPTTEIAIFSILADWSNFHVDSQAHSSLLALLGRGWVIYAQRDCAMPESLGSGIRALHNEISRKGKRSNDWRLLSSVDLTNTLEVKRLLQQVGPGATPADFLRIALHTLETDVAPANDAKLNSAENTETTGKSEQADAQTSATNSKQSTRANGSESLDSDSSLDESKSIHLDPRRIAARLSTADYSSALSKLGIDHRDHLLLEDLAAITWTLSRELETGSRVERGYAVFHLVCLLTSTSDLYALQIQLHPHADHLWLDIKQGIWCWDFSPYRYSGKERPLPPPIEPISIPLPFIIAQLLKDEYARGTYNNLQELICSMQEVENFDLEHARAYLQHLGDPAHPPYRGRWSNSMAPTVLEVTGSDMLTASTTARFAATAPAAMFYFFPSYSTIYNRLNLVFNQLHLGPSTRPFEPNALMGKSRLPSGETIQKGWSRLTTDCANQAETICEAKTDAEAIQLANNQMSLLAAAFVVQSAHRSQRFDQLTYSALASRLGVLVVHDKDILDEASRSHPRLLGQTKQLRAIVALAIQCRDQLSQKLSKRLSSVSPETPLFSNFESLEYLREKPVEPADISKVISNYFDGAAPNFGRALWITRLDEANCDRWLIRTLSGHVRDITRTNGPFFDMPPARAASLLAASMDALTTSIFGAAEVSELPIKLNRLMPHSATPSYAVSVRQSKMSPHTILEPITSDTLLGAGLAEEIRIAIRGAKAAELSMRSSLLLHLMFIDLLDGEAIALAAVESPADWFTFDAPRPGIKWKRPHFAHSFWFPLSPESSQLSQKVGSLHVSRLELVSEIQGFLERELSLNLGDDVMGQICRWARAYKRLFFPPSLLASATSYVESPCLNQASLIRLSHDCTTPASHTSVRSNSVRSRAKVSEDLSRLGNIINTYGDVNERLGERRKRAINALKEIAELPCDWTPCGLFLRDWIIEELERSRDNKHGRYKVSSLSTYFRRLKVGIDARLGDPYDWSTEQWAEYVTTIEVKYGSKEFKFGDDLTSDTQNALGSLTRSLNRRGYGLPAELWLPLKMDFPDDLRRDSASSVLLTDQNLREVEFVLEGALNDYPPNLLRCKFRVRVGSKIPMRAGDFPGIKKIFLTAGGGLVIERSGYGSIKNQQSVRVIKLRITDQQEVEGLAEELRRYVTSGDLLLRGTGRGDDNEEDLRSQSIFSWSIKLVAGDLKARPHSLRATTLQNLAWPDWQVNCKQYLNCKLQSADLIAWTEKNNDSWLRTASAAAAAGQSGITSALHNYLAGWTLVHALHASSLVAKLPYASAYASTLGLSDDALRQAKSRVNRTAPNSFVLFDWLESKVSQQRRAPQKSETPYKRNSAKQLTDAGPPLATEDNCEPSRNVVVEINVKSLRFLTMRALGETSSSLQNHFRSSSSHLAKLELLVPAKSQVVECNKRAREGVEPRGLAAQVRLIESDIGLQLVDWVLGLSARQFASASYGLLWFLPTSQHKNECEIEQWQELAANLPSNLAIWIHRGRKHLTQAELRFHNQSNLAFRPERDLGRRHRASIHLRNEPDNRVQSTRLTSCTQVLLLSLLSLRGQAHV